MSTHGTSPNFGANVELKKRPLSSSSANATPRKRFEEDDTARGDDLWRDSILDDNNTQNPPLSMMEEGLETSNDRAPSNDDAVLNKRTGEVEIVSDSSTSRPTSTGFETVIVFDKTDFEDILKSLTPEREVHFRRRSASARLSRYSSEDDDEEELNEARRRRYLSLEGALNRGSLKDAREKLPSLENYEFTRVDASAEGEKDAVFDDTDPDDSPAHQLDRLLSTLPLNGSRGGSSRNAGDCTDAFNNFFYNACDNVDGNDINDGRQTFEKAYLSTPSSVRAKSDTPSSPNAQSAILFHSDNCTSSNRSAAKDSSLDINSSISSSSTSSPPPLPPHRRKKSLRLHHNKTDKCNSLNGVDDGADNNVSDSCGANNAVSDGNGADDDATEENSSDNAPKTRLPTTENDNSYYNDEHDYAEISECVTFSVAFSAGDKANGDEESSEPRYSTAFYEHEEEDPYETKLLPILGCDPIANSPSSLDSAPPPLPPPMQPPRPPPATTIPPPKRSITPTSPSKLSMSERVVQEIVDTEVTFVQDLSAIIQGYLDPLQKAAKKKPLPSFTDDDVAELFGNFESIYLFNFKFCASLRLCDGNPSAVAQRFLDHREGFDIYAEYCNNSQRSNNHLLKCLENPETAAYLKCLQEKLDHGLPLASYLLKPVQRILKYHLLLQALLKHFPEGRSGGEVVARALTAMTDIAHRINENKRQHEVAVRIGEIQSLLRCSERLLENSGKLVIEAKFRVFGAKAPRHLFLFEKNLLICKTKENEKKLAVKAVISCANLMVVEIIPKEPLCFHVLAYDNPKEQFTIQAKSTVEKRAWTHHLKRLMLENYSYYIPEKAKELVLDHLGQSMSEEEEHQVKAKTPTFSIKQLLEQSAVGLASPFNAISGNVYAARSPLTSRVPPKLSHNAPSGSAGRDVLKGASSPISSSKSVGDLKVVRGRDENILRKQRRRRKRRTRTGSAERDDESSDRDSVMTRSTTDTNSISTEATSSCKSEDLLRFISFDDEDDDDENIYTTVTFKTVKSRDSDSHTRMGSGVASGSGGDSVTDLPPHHRFSQRFIRIGTRDDKYESSEDSEEDRYMELIFDKGSSSKPSSASSTPRLTNKISHGAPRSSRSDAGCLGDDERLDKDDSRGSGNTSKSNIAQQLTKSFRERLSHGKIESSPSPSISKTLPRSPSNSKPSISRRFSLGPHEGNLIDRALVSSSPSSASTKVDDSIWVKSSSSSLFQRSASYDQKKIHKPEVVSARDAERKSSVASFFSPTPPKHPSSVARHAQKNSNDRILPPPPPPKSDKVKRKTSFNLKRMKSPMERQPSADGNDSGPIESGVRSCVSQPFLVRRQSRVKENDEGDSSGAEQETRAINASKVRSRVSTFETLSSPQMGKRHQPPLLPPKMRAKSQSYLVSAFQRDNSDSDKCSPEVLSPQVFLTKSVDDVADANEISGSFDGVLDNSPDSTEKLGSFRVAVNSIKARLPMSRKTSLPAPARRPPASASPTCRSRFLKTRPVSMIENHAMAAQGPPPSPLRASPSVANDGPNSNEGVASSGSESTISLQPIQLKSPRKYSSESGSFKKVNNTWEFGNGKLAVIGARMADPHLNSKQAEGSLYESVVLGEDNRLRHHFSSPLTSPIVTSSEQKTNEGISPPSRYDNRDSGHASFTFQDAETSGSSQDHSSNNQRARCSSDFHSTLFEEVNGAEDEEYYERHLETCLESGSDATSGSHLDEELGCRESGIFSDEAEVQSNRASLQYNSTDRVSRMPENHYRPKVRSISPQSNAKWMDAAVQRRARSMEPTGAPRLIHGKPRRVTSPIIEQKMRELSRNCVFEKRTGNRKSVELINSESSSVKERQKLLLRSRFGANGTLGGYSRENQGSGEEEEEAETEEEQEEPLEVEVMRNNAECRGGSPRKGNSYLTQDIEEEEEGDLGSESEQHDSELSAAGWVKQMVSKFQI